MTITDAAIRRLIRRAERGEITATEWCAVLNEHQVPRDRLRRVSDADLSAGMWWRYVVLAIPPLLTAAALAIVAWRRFVGA